MVFDRYLTFCCCSVLRCSLLTKLFAELAQGHAHYIRCLASNNQAKAHVFDKVAVRDQLRASGIIDSLQVFATGKPCRFDYETACVRYHCLLAEETSGSSAKARCQQMLSRVLGPDADYLLGKTTAFLSDAHVEMLDAAFKARREAAAVVLQV